MTDPPHEIAAALLADGRELTVRTAGEADAPALLELIHRAFGSRPVVGAPSEALTDDLAAIVQRLRGGTGYVAEIEGEAVANVMVAGDEGVLRLGRVCVDPRYRRHGIAAFLVDIVLEHQADGETPTVRLLARREYPQIQAWWARRGFVPVGRTDDSVVMERALPVRAEAPDADAMRALGVRIASLLRAGDLVIASGDLGAGKTTLAQGIGEGLGVRGPVISPTFVLSRVHPSTVGGPALVHVDAYRLGSFAELEDIDLEESLADSVTLVEWGTGVAEGLAADRLEITIQRGTDPADDTRSVLLTPVGSRWSRADLARACKENA